MPLWTDQQGRVKLGDIRRLFVLMVEQSWCWGEVHIWKVRLISVNDLKNSHYDIANKTLLSRRMPKDGNTMGGQPWTSKIVSGPSRKLACPSVLLRVADVLTNSHIDLCTRGLVRS